MGGWKLEMFRYGVLVAFPVGSFWMFNQGDFMKWLFNNFASDRHDRNPGDTRMLTEFMEQHKAKQNRDDFEQYLREQMQMEEVKQLADERKRQQEKIG